MKAPLIMPSSGAAQQVFEPQTVDFAAPEASGYIGGVQAGFPLWGGTWTIGTIGSSKSDEWRSFLAELRGSQRMFVGSDIYRPYPLAHLDGFTRMTRFDGSPFDGSATSWSQSIDANDDQLLTLNGLPAGLTLSNLDYVGFKWTATSPEIAGIEMRTVARVIRGGGGVADASGVLAGIKVEPPIPTCVPGGATAHLDNPGVTMKLDRGSSQLDPIDRRGAVKGGTIVGVQNLRS